MMPDEQLSGQPVDQTNANEITVRWNRFRKLPAGGSIGPEIFFRTGECVPAKCCRGRPSRFWRPAQLASWVASEKALNLA
jgi:hypothetical protein